MTFVFPGMPEAYPKILRHIMNDGSHVQPRGMLTKEVIGFSFALENPMRNVVTHIERQVSLPFMAAELLWILTGSNDARLITPYNKKIGQFSEAGFFKGAYGPKISDQLPYIVQTLLVDPSSRQALLTIWRERPGPSKDIPCTVLMQFFVRENYLDMLVYMRSNDAWLGLPYDVFNFTMIQSYVASLLGVDVGTYHHHVGSLHLYQEHWDKARAVTAARFDQPEVVSKFLIAPMPPEVLTVFTGISMLGESKGITASDVSGWLNLSMVGRHHEWMDLLELCAYRFHKDPKLISMMYRKLVEYWAGSTDEA